MSRQTDRDSYTDRQAERQTEGRRDRQTDGRTERQTDTDSQTWTPIGPWQTPESYAIGKTLLKKAGEQCQDLSHQWHAPDPWVRSLGVTRGWCDVC